MRSSPDFWVAPTLVFKFCARSVSGAAAQKAVISGGLMVLRVRRSEASAGMLSDSPIRAAVNTFGQQQLVKQYLNITTKSKFQGSIGFVCETPLFHKTRPRGAAGKNVKAGIRRRAGWA
jgi:hypothetical protein